jgi:hypothetical protein
MDRAVSHRSAGAASRSFWLDREGLPVLESKRARPIFHSVLLVAHVSHPDSGRGAEA